MNLLSLSKRLSPVSGLNCLFVSDLYCFFSVILFTSEIVTWLKCKKTTTITYCCGIKHYAIKFKINSFLVNLCTELNHCFAKST